MSFFYFSIALAILANVTYHLFQKSISLNAAPVVSLLITYLVAGAFTLLLLVLLPKIFLPEGSLVGEIRKLNWASYALGLSIVGLELGFLLAYRAGWKLSLAGLFANVAVGLLLLPIGILFLKEKLSLIQTLGVFFALLGLTLLSRR